MNLPEIPGAPIEVLVFAGVAFLAVAASLAVVVARDPFVSALSLLGNFVALGVLYLLLEQPFVAVAQILVYAGAVVVLFLFVIAYLGDRRELPSTGQRAPFILPLGVLTAIVVAGLLGGVALFASWPEAADVAPGFGSAAAVGEAFLTTYLLEFEVTSLVLLVAAVGGIVLGLTGRARHDRLRKLMSTRSADQQRRWYEDRQRGRDVGEAPGGLTAREARDQHVVSGKEQP